MLIDSHCHLTDAQFADDLDAVLARANAAGVGAMVCAGTDVASSRAAVRLAEQYESVYAVVGIHPHSLTPSQALSSSRSAQPGVSAGSEPVSMGEEAIRAIRELAQQRKVVGVGEIGLDFHYPNAAPREIQEENFVGHLDLAVELGLPVVIHDRDAHEALMAILRAHTKRLSADGQRNHSRGILHCFSGDLAMAQEAIDLGYTLSFAGNLTFQNARRLCDLAVTVPLERVVIETDAPYLAPMPNRGKRNEPALVARVAEKIAQLKSLPREVVQETTSRNSEILFRLNLPRSGGSPSAIARA